MSVSILKSDKEKQIVYGIVSDPYGKNGIEIDAHNDWISPKAVEEMAHEFLTTSRTIYLQHKTPSKAKVVESWIEQYPNAAEYKKAMGNEDHKIHRRVFGEDVIHSGSWAMGVQLSDDDWRLFKTGKLNGFSIGGSGVRAPLETTRLPKIEIVDLVENEKTKN